MGVPGRLGGTLANCGPPPTRAPRVVVFETATEGKAGKGGSQVRTAASRVVAVFRAVLGVTLQEALPVAAAAPNPGTAPTPELEAAAFLEPLAAAAAALQTPASSSKAAGTSQSR